MAKNTTMRKVSLRNIAAHKLRLALTVVAVVLGTAFISGAFMFTNSLSNTFESAVSSAYEGVDVVVSADPEAGVPGVPVEVHDAIEQHPDVVLTNLNDSTTVVLADAEGTAIQTGGAPTLLEIWYDESEVVGQGRELVEGSAPTAGDELVINAAAAESHGLALGDEVIVVDPQQRMNATIVGISESDLDAGGVVTLGIPEDAYLDRFYEPGFLPTVMIGADEGVDATVLMEELAAEHDAVVVETGQALADQASELMQVALSFINYFLVAFGLVALLVGTFLIANTFAMIVAQRTKEFALLRALGASRKQITSSVVFEAFIVGVIGSVLGVLAGIGLVAAIKAVLAAQGLALPDSGLGLSTSAIVVPILLGTLVTIISAWMPARRAGDVEPVEAMRTTESASGSPLKVRTAIGVVLIAIGVLAALGGMWWEDGSTGNRASLVGVGTLGVVIGFFLAGPAFSIPIVPSVGRVIGIPFGAVGKLAATNSRRNPRRTSATAFALTLGIALVTAIGMLGESMKASISDVFENNVSADYILSGPTTGNFPTPAETPQLARDTAGVGEVLTMSQAPVTVDGEAAFQFGPQASTGVIDGNPENMASTVMQEGTPDIGADGVLVTTDFAAANGWQVGDTFELAAPGVSQQTTEVELIGIFEPNNVFDNMMVSQDAVEEILPMGALTVTMVGVNGDGSVPVEDLRTNLEEAVADYIVIQVVSADEMGDQASQAVDQMLNILYALLALAVIIAILGIVNTLTLNVIERRQEIGMLRAVGGHRRQIRIMITLEAVQIAVFGAVMGILIGLFLGWTFLEVLADEGLDTISIPIANLLWMLAGSVVVGILAAVWPANRAAKTPPLDAIADE